MSFKTLALVPWCAKCTPKGMSHLTRRAFLMAVPALTFASRPRTPSLVQVDLEAAQQWLTIGGRRGLLYAYNNLVPGPVLEARPGDTLRLKFRNNLPEETNLHFHGLHTPPTGNADNSFLMLPAGESDTWELPVPANHPAGTFWIHPHIHGKSARQVSRGLAMPLIIRGDLDEIPEIAAAPEYLLTIQDFDLDPAGYPREPGGTGTMRGHGFSGREGPLVTTNGLLNPTLTITAGALIRLHLLNASSSRSCHLALEKHTMQQLASSGGGLPAPRTLQKLSLAPGERAQVIVQGTETGGSYRLLALPGEGSGGGASSMGSNSVITAVLATLIYTSGKIRQVPLPSQLVNVASLGTPQRQRTFILSADMAMSGDMAMRGASSFTINGLNFNPARVDTTVRLGDIEDWEFINTSAMDHPMHVHTNPFQVVQPDGTAERAWRDIVNVPAYGRAKIRTQFLDYTGKTLYHCHILEHEDRGMMGILEIGS